MNNLTDVYSERFFRSRYKLNWRGGIFCKPIKEILKPKTLIDVGCATGDFVRWFMDHGVDAYGLEGSTAAKGHMVIPPEKTIFQDLRIPFNPPRKYDLCMSVEVAEHIEPEFAEIYVKNLTALSNLLLLTIAGPGQEGRSHVNLQLPKYWDDLFGKYIFVRMFKIEREIKESLYEHRHNRWIKTIIHNLAIYQKGECDGISR